MNLSDLAHLDPRLLVILLIWSVIWKGLALWAAARGNQKAWFVALLLINTVGILEILYLYLFQPKKAGTTQSLNPL